MAELTLTPSYTHGVALNQRVAITPFESGAEQRRLLWTRPRYSFALSFLHMDETKRRMLHSFWKARKGMYETFDWEEPTLSPVESEDVGTGDGSDTTFSLEFRNVSAYTIYVNDAEQTEGVDYSIVAATGAITFTAPPALGAAITADYTHKFSVRFASPLQIENVSYQIYNARVQLIEVI